MVEESLITQEQFDQALKKHWDTGVSFRQVITDMGFISEDRLMEFTAKVLEIPFVRDVIGQVGDPEVFKIFSEKVCRQYCIMPLYLTNKILTVAMADPFDVFALDDLEAIAKCRVDTLLAKKEDIVRAIDRFYKAQEALEEIVKGIEEDDDLEIVKETKDEEAEGEPFEQVDAPIIRLVNTMITQAIKEKASDIHVEPEENGLRIRYRIDGILRDTMMPPKRLQAAITSRIKIMSGMDISIKRNPQDGRFKLRVENRDFDVRISTIPTIYGEKVVMRLLDQNSIKMGLPEAGFGDESYKKFREMIERPYGIILVTGPTGSGKTTTLYLALQAINSPDKNIITIEEPVEYDLERVNQIPVNNKAGLTFAKGLRSILRQDPDVIMVGEMRDLETADVAVRAALTGHLVFSTLHTNDAVSAIARMIDMGVPPYLVTSSVCCVLAQRLVRVVCPKCKQAYTPAEDLLKEAELDSAEHVFYRGQGCDYCGQTGFRGRTGIFELMVLDKELRNLIHANESGDRIKQAAQKNGMKLLWQDGLDKVLKGHTTLEELKRVAFTEEM